MTVISTQFDTESEQFHLDSQAMLDALEPLQTLSAQVLAAGGDKSVERHRARGKLLARERVDLLLDEDAPFLELSCYAGARLLRATWWPAHHRDRADPRCGVHGHRQSVDGQRRIAQS